MKEFIAVGSIAVLATVLVGCIYVSGYQQGIREGKRQEQHADAAAGWRVERGRFKYDGEHELSDEMAMSLVGRIDWLGSRLDEARQAAAVTVCGSAPAGYKLYQVPAGEIFEPNLAVTK